jgi:hypothetical protein
MERSLKLGEAARIGGGLFVSRRMIYAGEVSSGVFSVVAEWGAGYNSAAYNLYFRENQGSFRLLGGTLTVLAASQHELRFRFDK